MYSLIKKTFLFALTVVCCASAHSQTFWERSHLGLGIGGMKYMGDVRSPYTKFAIQGTYTYELTDHINLRGQLFFGSVGASDEGTPPYLNEWIDEANGIRNPAARPHPFNSRIQEGSILGEYNLLNMNQESRWTPYGIIGFGFFRYTPYYTAYSASQNRFVNIRYNSDTWKERLKLGIPFGGGIKYALSDNIRIFGEGNFRYTTTDQIDALSAQGSSKSNDYYYSIMVGVTFRLGGNYNSGSSSNGKGTKANRKGCPPVYL